VVGLRRPVPRRLEPELLDTLPPDSPAARRSRRDLLRVNHVMGNVAWFRRMLPPLHRPGERLLELGAGDGALGLTLRADGLRVDGLDRLPAPALWPASAAWHQTDLQHFNGWSDYPVILANLFLHHLGEADLAELGRHLDHHARLLLCNEPLRHTRSRLLWALGAPLGGASRVTRHDGRISITAGFRGDELPLALGLPAARWAWRVEETWLGAHRLVAWRRP
jgi:hypothetical protein